jgi:hypothetical protein
VEGSPDRPSDDLTFRVIVDDVRDALSSVVSEKADFILYVVIGGFIVAGTIVAVVVGGVMGALLGCATAACIGVITIVVMMVIAFIDDLGFGGDTRAVVYDVLVAMSFVIAGVILSAVLGMAGVAGDVLGVIIGSSVGFLGAVMGMDAVDSAVEVVIFTVVSAAHMVRRIRKWRHGGRWLS